MVEVIDRQLKSLPTEVKFCRRCVVSNQRPRIVFDTNGICSACRFAERKQKGIDWAERERMLWQLLDRYRSKDGSYDVIVPASGGKDSGAVAHKLKHKYGMHPLTVTFSPFLYTDIGLRNFDSFVDSGFDNLMGTPNGRIYRQLARTGFELVGDAWQPFAFGQVSFVLNMSVRFGIPLVFYGENGEAEYGGDTGHNDRACQTLADMADHPNYIKAPLEELVRQGVSHGWIDERDARTAVNFFAMPRLEDLARVDAQYHWFSFYEKWIPQENYYYAREHCGFEANPAGRSEGTYSKYASLDDRTDGYHYYLAFIKFGIGRATSDAAHEVRDGHITREEAVSLVRRYDGEFPAKYFPEFLKYLGITEEHFWTVIDRYRLPHIWQRHDSEWRLKHAVWHPEHALLSESS